jgi:hypothetical protein
LEKIPLLTLAGPPGATEDTGWRRLVLTQRHGLLLERTPGRLLKNGASPPAPEGYAREKDARY